MLINHGWWKKSTLTSFALATGLVLPANKAFGTWLAGLSADYFADMQGTNPASSFGLNASTDYQGYTLTMSQSIVKPYFIYPGESPIDFSDTVISLSHPLPEWLEGMNLSLSATATLPLSQYSRRNDIYTKPKMALAASHKFFEDKLQFSYGIHTMLYISEFQSEATGAGRGGGALPKFGYGYSHSGRYKLNQDFSTSYSLSYNQTYYYSLDPTTTEALTVVNLPDETYSVSFSLGWSISDQWSLSAGLTQGTQILHGGTVDLVIYDVARSQWFLVTRYQL